MVEVEVVLVAEELLEVVVGAGGEVVLVEGRARVFLGFGGGRGRSCGGRTGIGRISLIWRAISRSYLDSISSSCACSQSGPSHTAGDQPYAGRFSDEDECATENVERCDFAPSAATETASVLLNTASFIARRDRAGKRRSGRDSRRRGESGKSQKLNENLSGISTCCARRSGFLPSHAVASPVSTRSKEQPSRDFPHLSPFPINLHALSLESIEKISVPSRSCEIAICIFFFPFRRWTKKSGNCWPTRSRPIRMCGSARNCD